MNLRNATLLILLAFAQIFGQSQSAAMFGKITDERGAAIKNAVVTIENERQKLTATTGDDGNFKFDSLKLQNYRIVVTKNGFADSTRTVTLIENRQFELNFTLQIGAVNAEVEVAAPNETYVTTNNQTALKSNVRSLDAPQNIEVINQNLLTDRATFDFARAAEQNAAGVTRDTTDLTGSGAGDFLRLRGFEASYNNNYLRDGLKFANYGANEIADVERVEILKGTSSVLYGRAEPGGVVNLVTKQPQADSVYSLQFTAGQFNFYRPQFDATGTVLGSEKLLYRVNAAYQADGGFQDFSGGKRGFVAPVLLWKPTNKAEIKFFGEFLKERRGIESAQLTVNGKPADVPVTRNYGEPFNRAFQQNRNFGVRGRYEFNSKLSVSSAYRGQLLDYSLFVVFPAFFGQPLAADNRTVIRDLASTDYTERWHDSDSSLNARFSTGTIKHNVVAGYEYGYQNGIYHHDYYFGNLLGAFRFPTTDVYTPTPALNREFAQNYIKSVAAFRFPSYYRLRLESNGVYAQDLIQITKQFKALIGVRADNYKQRFGYENSTLIERTNDTAISPRFGLVYQPREFVAIYANYGRAFRPQFPNQSTFDNRAFAPSTGEQFEAGAKFDALGGKLVSTVALYNLTYKNLLAADPNNAGFSIQTGKQRSRGIEIDLTAQPVRNLNLTANYAATQAQVTSNTNRLLVGRFLPNTARHNANVWATYKFDKDILRGFGFGAGLQAVGRRFTSLGNNAILPAFARVDATAFYEFDANEKTRTRFAVNLENVTDKRYYESAFTYNNTVYAAAPFRALASFRITRK